MRGYRRSEWLRSRIIKSLGFKVMLLWDMTQAAIASAIVASVFFITMVIIAFFMIKIVESFTI